MKKRNIAVVLLALGLSFLLSGCFFRGVDELYMVPQPPEDYKALQVCLSQVIDQGGEYAAPLSGDMIQSVQLQDLDGDGRQEAIAFFRLPNEEKPMKVYIFRQVGDAYQTIGIIEGAATAINSIEYAQMDEDPYRELVISWQMSTSARTLSVYSVGTEIAELLRTDYDSYRLYDMDQDNQQELVVFRTPSEASPRVELYDHEGILTLVSSAPLSTGAVLGADGVVKSDYLTALQVGYLSDRSPAIFATSTYGEGGAITDIYVVKDGKLQNVTLDGHTNESGETIRYYTQAGLWDINGDGIMEVPKPSPLVDSRRGSVVSHWLVQWRQFDSNGQPQDIMNTYYNNRDGWYFVLPEGWSGKNLILSRSDLPGGGEQAVTFAYWSGREGEDSLPFLTVYKLTGTNRVSRSKRPGRFTITPPGTEEDTIYAAELHDDWDSGLTEEEVKERFAVIKTDWYS